MTLNAWPTCVCVKPNANRRNLNAFANCLISSKLIPSIVVSSLKGNVASVVAIVGELSSSSNGHFSFVSDELNKYMRSI